MNRFHSFSPVEVDAAELPSVDLPELPSPEALAIIAAHKRALGQDKPVPPARGTRARLIYEAGKKAGFCI
jgi:hypothetical protein